MVWAPMPPFVTKFWNVLFSCVEPEASDEPCRMAAVSTRPSRVATSAVMTWIGDADAKLSRASSEPVTTIFS